MSTIFALTLYTRRWFLLGWSLAVSGIIFFVLQLFPSFSQGGIAQEFAATIPDEFAALIGDPASFTTISGFLATQLYQIRVPILLMILTLMLALSLTVSEEEKGTLRTLAATNSSRVRIALEKWFAGFTIITVIAVVSSTATVLSLLVIGEDIPFQLIAELAVVSVVFAAAAFTVPFSVALATGSRAATLFTGIAATLGSFIITSFALNVSWLEPWDVVSLLHYLDAESIPTNGLNPGHLLVLGLITIVPLTISAILFRSRDMGRN